MGLRISDNSSSLRAFLTASLPLAVDIADAGRFPLALEDEEPVGYICSVGGVPMVSDPCEEGEG